MDWRQELWIWVPWLAKKMECPEKNAASWLGQMVKLYGGDHESVVKVLNFAAANNVLDIRSYVPKAIAEATEQVKKELSELDQENLKKLRAGEPLPPWLDTTAYREFLESHWQPTKALPRKPMPKRVP